MCNVYVFRSKSWDCRDCILHEDDAVYKFIRKLIRPSVGGRYEVRATGRRLQNSLKLKTDPLASRVLTRRMSEDNVLFQWPNKL